MAQDDELVAPPTWFPITDKPTYAPITDPTNEAEFYRWAWQTFLCITQSDPGTSVPRFLTFMTPQEVFGSMDASPRFPKQESGMLMLAPRFQELKTFPGLEEFKQAGLHAVLIDQNGQAVYYGIHVNDVFANFIKTNGFQDMTKMSQASPKLEFPKGSLELKSSWKIVAPSDDTSHFFTTTAVLPMLINSPKGVIIDPDPHHTRIDKVALVVLHVVGVIEGHPEFVWATFEQRDNAPNFLGVKPSEAVNNDKDKHFTFYAQGELASKCNQPKWESA